MTKEAPASDQLFAKPSTPDLIGTASPSLAVKTQQIVRNETADSRQAQDQSSATFQPSSSNNKLKLSTANSIIEQLNKSSAATEPSSQPVNRLDKNLTLIGINNAANQNKSVNNEPSINRQVPSLNSGNPPGSPTGSVKSLSSALSNLIASKVPNSSRGLQPLKTPQAPAQPQIHVPQFYFPHGKPEEKQFKNSSDLDAMRQVNAEFRNHKDGKLFKEDFSDLLKLLGKLLLLPDSPRERQR